MATSEFRIAIIGGGPAGLTLGLLLQRRGIPFTIYELRQKPTEEDFSKPAGSLDLHEESGLAALRACDLYEDFVSATGDCTEAQRLSNKHGEIIYKDEGELSERPEISRLKLIKLILSELPAATIRWGHKLISAKSIRDPAAQEAIELNFGDNGKQRFDLVVGADGAWSRVRALLTDRVPHYSGLQCVTLNIRHVKSTSPHLEELIGSGTFTSLGEGHGIFSQRSVDDSARVYIFLSTLNEHFPDATGLSGKTALQAKDQLLGEELPFSKWATSLKELVAVACEDEAAASPGSRLDIKPLYTLPNGFTWKHRHGATAVGDAAHLMCPWAGEGVNLAMKDALDLAQAIGSALDAADEETVSLREKVDSFIERFEAAMMANAKEKAEETQANGLMMFGKGDTAAAMAAFFQGAYGQ